MFQLNSEKNLLILIKIVPIFIITLFAIVTTYFALSESNLILNQKLDTIKQDLTEKTKNRIQEEVLRVFKLIEYETNATEEKLKNTIKQRVYEAHAILNTIYNENQNKPKDQVVKMMKDALKNIRFNNGRGYYFIYQMDGINIMLPPSPKLENKNFWNFKDAKNVYTIRGMSEVVKKDEEGFYSWYWNKPNDKSTQYKKIGFGKYFKPYNWFIGTGEYIKDFEDDLKKNIINKIGNIKFTDDGYIFLIDYNGKTLSHINPDLIGKNTINLQDPNGFMIVKEIIKTAKSNQGFIKYYWPITPDSNHYSEKISFIKGIKNWDWAIGSGFYVDTLDDEINKRANEIKNAHQIAIKKIWILSISLTITFLIMSLIMSYLVKKIFVNYKNSVAKRDQQLAEQSKLVAMGEMIGNIAHQWRQPLSVISTASTGMKLQHESNILKDEDIEKLCDTINDNAQYLSKTIDDFRNFIKGDRTKKYFYLNDTVTSFLHLLEGSIKNNHIKIHCDIDAKLQIESYQNELIQCLINIFNNSKDALKEIKGDRHFFISIDKIDNGFIRIKLKDNAGGIPNNIIERVFEPYFTTKHQSQGTGLGLSMSYNLIVNGMNGSLDVENVNYKYKDQNYIGAEFIIKLPVK